MAGTKVRCSGCGRERALAEVQVPVLTSGGESGVATWTEGPPQTWLHLTTSAGRYAVCGRGCAKAVSERLPRTAWVSRELAEAAGSLDEDDE